MPLVRLGGNRFGGAEKHRRSPTDPKTRSVPMHPPHEQGLVGDKHRQGLPASLGKQKTGMNQWFMPVCIE